jgi:hypothetical protein
MEWHFNDLSLKGQFKSPEEAKQLFVDLIKFRSRREDLSKRLFCSRALLARPVTASLNLQQMIMGTGDRKLIEAAIRWFANSGPFWDDTKQQADDDLFYWTHLDVTDTGLGEAARRRLAAVEARSFSVTASGDEFDAELLLIIHGLLEARIGQVDVPNARSVADIENTPLAEITSWENTLTVAAAANQRLQLSPHLISDLAPRPFNVAIAHKLLHLLSILNQLSTETTPEGKLTDVGLAIHQKFFVGEYSAFSSENPKNVDTFKFADPDGGPTIDCPWHGKINIGDPFRFHYEWPKPKNQQKLKVLYMGQKLTKS